MNLVPHVPGKCPSHRAIGYSATGSVAMALTRNYVLDLRTFFCQSLSELKHSHEKFQF